MSFARIMDLKRFMLISPELLLVLVVYWFYQHYPEWFSAISVALRENKGLPSFIGGIPFALVVASYKLGMEVLKPGNEEENELFCKWPLYWAVEARVYGSLIASAVCCVAAALFYLNPNGWKDESSGALLVGALVVSSTTVFTLLIGKLSVQKIFFMHR